MAGCTSRLQHLACGSGLLRRESSITTVTVERAYEIFNLSTSFPLPLHIGKHWKKTTILQFRRFFLSGGLKTHFRKTCMAGFLVGNFVSLHLQKTASKSDRSFGFRAEKMRMYPAKLLLVSDPKCYLGHSLVSWEVSL